MFEIIMSNLPNSEIEIWTVPVTSAVSFYTVKVC